MFFFLFTWPDCGKGFKSSAVLLCLGKTSKKKNVLEFYFPQFSFASKPWFNLHFFIHSASFINPDLIN